MKTRYIVFLMLLAAPPAWSADDAPRPGVEYQAIFLGGNKIGHVKVTMRLQENKVLTTEDVFLEIRRGNVAVKITETFTYIESFDGRPLAFRTVINSGLMSQKTEGELHDGKCHVAATVGKNTTRRVMDWPQGALLSYGQKRLMKQKGLAPGTKYEYVMMNLEDLTPMKVAVVVGDKKEIDVLGKPRRLAEVTETMQMGLSRIVSREYLDDDFRMIKSQIPMLGMQMEFYACDEAFALGRNDETTDWMMKLCVASPQPLDLKNAKSVCYRLRAKPGYKIKVPSIAGQTVRPTRDGADVTVTYATDPQGAVRPYAGEDREALEALKPSTNVQSDAPEIRDCARQVVGDTKDAAQAARKIEGFVHQYIRRKNLSVAYASALEVLKKPEGDCSEHALLTAALCRAAGIPAKVVMGLMYVDQWGGQKTFFGPHAWTLACTGDAWITLDATLPGSPGPSRNLRRIVLAAGDGELAGFLGLLDSLGQFTITQVDIHR
jgi:hypothetical protein